jgi:hypothetical protein
MIAARYLDARTGRSIADRIEGQRSPRIPRNRTLRRTPCDELLGLRISQPYFTSLPYGHNDVAAGDHKKRIAACRHLGL